MHTRSFKLSEPDYPSALHALACPPPLLRVRGRLPQVPGVAIVGTRHGSDEALRFAFDLAASVAAAGYAVWSGGAPGIDQAAHQGALSVGGVTALVAGGGLDCAYYQSAQELFSRILISGVLVSLVEDHELPRRWSFLARNGLLAAMTLGTVVVECPLKSGARSTSAAARRLGRPVWIGGQAPWSPFANAVREELRLGAQLLLCAEDLLASLDPMPLALRETHPRVTRRPNENRARKKNLAKSGELPLVRGRPATLEGCPGMTERGVQGVLPLAERIMVLLKAGPQHPDALREQLSVEIEELHRALAILCVVGRVCMVAHGSFACVTL